MAAKTKRKKSKLYFIVAGSLNTDIFCLNVPKIAASHELTYGGEIKIGAGGKSRNIAEMIAALTDKKETAMIGKTSMDPLGLWKIPYSALIKRNINTRYVKKVSFAKSGKYPGVAIIPVDKKGNNQIYVLPGINQDFCPRDIEKAISLVKQAARNNGLLVLTMEMPMPTLLKSLEIADRYDLRCVLDPGGAGSQNNYGKLLNKKIFLIKPNEYEAKILTGITVTGFKSAKRAAKKLLSKKIENVLITAGKKGAYFFNNNYSLHIKIPNLKMAGPKNETGCGDQVTAAFCAGIAEGKSPVESAKFAVLCGALQFHKEGIIPISRQEAEKYK